MKKIGFFLVIVALLCILFCGAASAWETSGTCGERVTWSLNNGILNISGSGEMTNYSGPSSTPWYGNASITKIIIDYGVTSIGDYAFDYCYNVTTVTLGSSVTRIGDCAFENCKSLTNINIPSSVKTIGDHAFSICENLANITIPNSVITIAECAFVNCFKLTSITIPSSVTGIGENAFLNCYIMSSIIVDSDNPNYCSVDGVLFNKSMTNLIKYPHGKEAAYEIPAGVTAIEKNAIYWCKNLTAVTIPVSVKNIGWMAISSNTNLQEVIYLGNQTQWANVTIGEDNSDLSDKKLSITVYKGTCGANASWRLDQHGVLTVSGEGAINNYSASYAPWYSYRSSIKTAKICSGITGIGNNAFYYCTNLTTLSISDGVTNIGNQTFSGCTGLTEITIPNSVISIGNQAFNGCTGLTRAVIPGSITRIGDQTFYGCTGLTNVTIKSGVTEIGNQVFYGCYNLSSITIPGGITNIGNSAFSNCRRLTSITLPNSLTSIGKQAFYGCSGLTSITLPTSLTNIGFQAFYNCTGLTEMTIPEGVNNFQSDSLTGCTNLSSVTIHGRTIELGGINSCGRSGLIDYLNGKNGTLFLFGNGAMNNYTKDQNFVSSDAPWGLCTKVIIDNGVTSIGDNAFIGNQLTEVSIPDSVTNIGNNAFYYCRGLNEVILPDNVTSIGNSAFYSCTGLTNVILPESLTSIGAFAFYKCTGLTEMILPDNLTSIEASLFSGCSALEHITIPGSVTSFGNYAFYQCGNLSELTIPDSVTSLGEVTFGDCTSLTSITVPDSVIQLNQKTFTNYTGKILCSLESETAISLGKTGRAFRVPGSSYDLRHLFVNNQQTGLEILNVDNVNQSFELPNDVTCIGANAFLDCTILESVSIPSSVTSIGNNAFSGCSNLESVSLPSSITSIDNNAFSGCSNLKSVSIPSSITIIGNNVFSGCSNLESVSIPNEFTGISEGMFYGCVHLSDLNLPNSITSIGNSAFYDCTGMTRISIPYTTSTIGLNAFAGCINLTEVVILSSNASFAASVFDPNAENLSLTVLPGSTAYDYAVANEIPYTIYNSVDETGLIYSVDADQTVTILGYEGTNSSIVIPPTIGGYPVAKIGANSFSRATDLASISLPDSLTSISNNAFSGCTARLYATARSSTAIELSKTSYPFAPYDENFVIIHSCQGSQITGTTLIGIINKNISSFTVPSYITTIGNSAFSECSNLISIDMSREIPVFSVSAFSGCPNSLTLILPNDTVYVGDAMFGACGDQAIYTCANGVLNIYGSGAIWDCPQEEYVISEHYSSYWDEWEYEYGYRPTAPWKDLSVNRIAIHEGITSVGLRAFEQLKSLTSVSFSASVQSIGGYVFSGCSLLSDVYFPSTPPTIMNTAFSSVSASIHYIPYESWTGKIQNYGGTLTWIKPNGNCGTDATWVLDSMDVLRINGNGIISEASWTEYSSTINSMILSPNITGINTGLVSTVPNLIQVIFEGDYPTDMAANAFAGISATIYYQHGNTTWIMDGFSGFGGNITWRPYCSHSGSSVDALHGEHYNRVDPDCITNGTVEHWQCASCNLLFADAAMAQRLSDEDLVIIAPGHTVIVFPGTPATCTETGLTDGIFCEVCGEVIQEQEEIPLAEHTDSITIPEIPATCISVGYTAEHRCSVCKALLAAVEEIPFGDHTDSISVEAVAPTCTSVGYTAEHRCAVCEIVLEEIQQVPMIPHTDHISAEAVEPTCSAVGHTAEHRCKVCNELLTASEEIPKLPHTDSITIEYLAPTCTVEGHGEEHTCTVCGEVTTESVVIPATGHTYHDPVTEWSENGKTCTFTFECIHEDDTKIVPVQAVGSISEAPACLEMGTTLYTATTEVNEITYSDTTTRVDIPATGHTVAEDPAVAPTDRETGLTAGSHCSVCNTVLTAQESVPALWSYTDDGLTATAYNGKETDLTIPDGVTTLGNTLFKNRTDIVSVHIPAEVTSVGTQTFYGATGIKDIWLPANLDNIGMQTFYNTTATLHAPAEGTTAKGISLRNKNFTDGEWTLRYKVTSVTSDPTAVYLISWQGNDADLVLPDTIGGAPLTQIQAGAFSGKDQLKTIVIPDSVTTIATDAFAECSENLVIRSSINAMAKTWASSNNFTWEHYPHTDVLDEAVAPTCTETGLTEGKHCSECGEELIARTIVPALGHNMTTITANPATCTDPGNSAYFTCSNCGKFFNDEVGETEIAEESWIIPTLGHEWGTPTYTWNNDNSKVTATRICAHDSEHVETETVNVTSEITKAATCEAKGETTYTSAAFENTAFIVQTKTLEDVPALGHEWDAPTYTWNADNSKVTATRVCAHDAEHVETETVTTTSEITKAATCEVKGETTYTSAAFENTAFTVQTKTVDDVSALGHEWGAPTYTWSADNSKVTATRICAHDAEHVETETVNVTFKITKAATCEVKGETTYTSAAFENTAFTVQTKTVDDVPALDHEWGVPTYTWNADNSRVSAERICLRDENHRETETVETTSEVTKEPTFEDVGETTYTAIFENAAFTVQTRTVADIEKLDYDWDAATYTWADDFSFVTATRVSKADPNIKETETVATSGMVTREASCTDAGETTYISGEFENEAFSSQTKVVANIPAKGHTEETVIGKAATCTETGLTEGKKCSVCGEILQSQELIPALGHDWGAATYSWSADNSKVTATRICAHDAGHVETETVSTTSEVTKAATCEAKGETTYTSAAFENTAFTVQMKTVDDVPALGHEWGAPTYTWNADNSKVTATLICAHDAEHVETETVNATSKITKAATCEAKGETTYTSAAFNNTAFITQTKTIDDVPALSHEWGVPVYEWNANNSKVTATRVCAHDAEHVETETVSTTSEITKAATCEAKGETTYTSAAFENTAFIAQTKTIDDIPALGHDWGTPTYTWNADNSKVTATRVCAHDAEHVETETVSTTSEITKAATCEEKGETTYTSAAFENTAFTAQMKTVDDVPALGHEWGAPTYRWSADNSKVTATRVCVHDAEHVETETVNVTSEVTKAATCEAKGETTYTSLAFENTAFTIQTKTVDDVPALGHEWGEPTYSWSADNSKVTATRVCAHDAEHVEMETVSTTSEITKAATCEAKGETTYTSVAFENTAFTIQTKTIDDIPALGYHTLTAHERVEPTCINGREAYWSCSLCGKLFADSEAKNEIEKPVTISPNGRHVFGEPYFIWNELWDFGYMDHNGMYVNLPRIDSVTAIFKCAHCGLEQSVSGNFDSKELENNDCFFPGEIEYVASVNFLGKQYTSEPYQIPGNMPRLSHDYKDITYTWNEDYTRCTARRECRYGDNVEEFEAAGITRETIEPTCTENGYDRCIAWFYIDGNEVSETHTVPNTETSPSGHNLTDHIKIDPTCTGNGTKAYWSCDTCGKLFSDIEAQNEIEAPVAIPALGHEWGEAIYTWSVDNSKVTATRVCAHNAEHVETETVNVTSEITKAATCEAKGETTYTSAAFENTAFTVQTKTVDDIPTLGHDWGMPTYTWNTDNSKVTATRVCVRDAEHVETETVETIRELVSAPTDEETGLYHVFSKAFENPAFTVQSNENYSIPALKDMNVLKLPAFLTTIETEAFDGIAAEAVIIPDGCITIEPRAFVDCENLLYVRVPAGVEIPEDAFSGCPYVMIDQR